MRNEIFSQEQMKTIEDGLVARQIQILSSFEMWWRTPKSAIFNTFENQKSGFPFNDDKRNEIADLMQQFIRANEIRNYLRVVDTNLQRVENGLKQVLEMGEQEVK